MTASPGGTDGADTDEVENDRPLESHEAYELPAEPPAWLIAAEPGADVLEEYARIPKNAAEYERAEENYNDDAFEHHRDGGLGGPDDLEYAYSGSPDPRELWFLEVMLEAYTHRSAPPDEAVSALIESCRMTAASLDRAPPEVETAEEEAWRLRDLADALESHAKEVARHWKAGWPRSAHSHAVDSEWSLKADKGPDPRLAFGATAGEESGDEVEPASIETAELMIAIRRAAKSVSADGVDREKFIRMAASELGYERTSARVGKAIDNGIRAASQRRIVVSERGFVYADCRTIKGYSRDDLKKVLLGAIGRGWVERAEATKLTARELGFERTGESIQKAIGSAITGLIRQGELEKDGKSIRRTR